MVPISILHSTCSMVYTCLQSTSSYISYIRGSYTLFFLLRTQYTGKFTHYSKTVHRSVCRHSQKVNISLALICGSTYFSHRATRTACSLAIVDSQSFHINTVTMHHPYEVAFVGRRWSPSHVIPPHNYWRPMAAKNCQRVDNRHNGSVGVFLSRWGDPITYLYRWHSETESIVSVVNPKINQVAIIRPYARHKNFSFEIIHEFPWDVVSVKFYAMSGAVAATIDYPNDKNIKAGDLSGDLKNRLLYDKYEFMAEATKICLFEVAATKQCVAGKIVYRPPVSQQNRSSRTSRKRPASSIDSSEKSN